MLGFNSQYYLKFIAGLSSLLWSRFEQTWHATIHTLSLSGWVGVVVSLIMGIFALRYAYQSKAIASQSLKLAEWSAKKEFLEMCLNVNVGILSLQILLPSLC